MTNVYFFGTAVFFGFGPFPICHIIDVERLGWPDLRAPRSLKPPGWCLSLFMQTHRARLGKEKTPFPLTFLRVSALHQSSAGEMDFFALLSLHDDPYIGAWRGG